MNYKILTPRFHGLLDYAAAAGLIALPFLLNLGATSKTAQWLSVAAGAGLVAYSLVTDYAYGAFGLVSFRAHLVLDLLAAAAFIVAPFVFGWGGLVLAYYLVMGTGVLVVVALSKPGERTARTAAAG